MTMLTAMLMMIIHIMSHLHQQMMMLMMMIMMITKKKINTNVKNKKLIQKPTKKYNKKGIAKSVKV